MIVQCEQCRTKFRLDDEKVTDRGVKVRCAKCRHVFTVKKEAEVTESEVASAAPAVAAPTVEDVWATGLPAADETVRMSAAVSPDPVVPGFAPEPEVAFDFGAAPFDSPAPETAAPAAGLSAGSVETSSGGTEFGEISFASEPAPAPVQGSDPFDLGQTDAAGGLDFGDLSFANEPAAAQAPDFGEMTMVMPPKKQEPVPSPDFEPGFAAAPAPAEPPAMDNPFDFGVLEAASVEPAAAPPAEAAPAAPETSAVPPEFDFPDAGLDDVPFQPAQPVEPPPVPEDNFGMQDIDFGAAIGSQEHASAPAVQAAVEPAITFDTAPAPQEAPPLSITSRRRQGSLLSVLLGILGLLVVGVGGFFGYSHLTNGDSPFKFFDKPVAPVEEGKIAVQKIQAFYLEKTAAGELLVISGEAVNRFTKPRAALQLKGSVFAPDGAALVSKVAYAGNQLSREQLSTMPLDKIEAAMSNQFGDSLANLEVQPGKAIFFTIVIVNPPKEGREFGVEAVGSTVAASK